MTTRVAAVVLLLSVSVWTQEAWVTHQAPSAQRLRGLSAVSASVAWASGNGGTVVRTIDGGRTWNLVSPPAAEHLDFRDIEAFDADVAVALAIGPGDRSRIYRTTDGGTSWTLTFTNGDPRMFFDALAFWDMSAGLAVGDPVDGRFTILRTADGGRSWRLLPGAGMPPALEGDGAFAASGTCLVASGSSSAWFASGGGARARVFRTSDRGDTWAVSDTPIAAGQPSAGIFSLAFRDDRHGVAVGGDYKRETDPGDYTAVTADGGVTWSATGLGRVRGFRSAVAFVPGSGGRRLLVAGPSGVDASDDGGRRWTAAGDIGYHALAISRDGAVWAVGEDGRIGTLRAGGR